MAACARLTELTVFFPYQYQDKNGEMDFLPNQAGRARSAIVDLVGACRSLPNFDTFQIVRFPIVPPRPVCLCAWPVCECYLFSREAWELSLERRTRGLGQQMKDLEEWTIDCLKEPKAVYQEGEGRGTTLRVIEFGRGRRSVRVGEYEV